METLGNRILWQEQKHKESSGGQNMLKPPKTSHSQYKISSPQSKWLRDDYAEWAIPTIGYAGSPDKTFRDLRFVNVDINKTGPLFVPMDDFWFMQDVSLQDATFNYIETRRAHVMVGIINTDESLNYKHLEMVERIVKAIGDNQEDMNQFYGHRLVIMTADEHREQWFRKEFHEAGVPLELVNKINIFINAGVCGDSMHGQNLRYPIIQQWLKENEYKFSNRFSMGIMSPKAHRTLLLHDLWKAGLLSCINYTYNAPGYSIPNEDVELSNSQRIIRSYKKYSRSNPDRYPALDETFVKWFNRNIPILSPEEKMLSERQENPKNYDWFQLYAYPKSLLNCPISIVTETLTESDHLPYNTPDQCTNIDYLGFIKYTEKTIRPMQFHRAFMVLGHYGTYEKLQDLGYQTFNDFWDEDGMSHRDIEKRLTCMVQNIQKISKMSGESFLSMYQEMQEILDHNQILTEHRLVKQQNEETLMGKVIYKYFKNMNALLPWTESE